jgi:SM-20-related protein
MPDPLSNLERIVEELAESGRSVQADFLAPAELRALREETAEAWRAGAFRRAGVGAGASAGVHSEIRGDNILWLETPATAAQQVYLDELERLRLALNRQLYLGLLGFEGHLAVYPPGSFYRKHLDRFQTAGRRVVSCILYLNDDWKAEDGGQLRLYAGPEEDAATQDVPPNGGNFVIFLSGSVLHEVLPATRERVSLTGWFLSRE